jgi:hypothetical protein
MTSKPETELVWYDEIARAEGKEFRIVPFIDGPGVAPGTRVWIRGKLPPGWKPVEDHEQKSGNVFVEKKEV